jgi:ABC-type enterobactin transport system permease subunit
VIEFIIAVGPKMWWIGLYIFWVNAGLVDIYIQNISAQVYIGAVEGWGLKEYALASYLSMQLIWAGTLSPQDWSNAINGIFSFSGTLFITILVFFAVNFSFLEFGIYRLAASLQNLL